MPAAATVVVLALLAVGCAAPAGDSPVTSAAPRAGALSSGPSTTGGPTAPASSSASVAGPTGVRPDVPSSPLLFPQADGSLTSAAATGGSVTLNPADGQTRDGEPYRPVVFTASNVWLVRSGGTTEFDLTIDAGDTVGSATQVRVSYDLTGDGSWDRVETYLYFATDPLPGAERYTQSSGVLAAQGSLGDLTGGVVRWEVWSALGNGGTAIDLAASSLLLPYST